MKTGMYGLLFLWIMCHTSSQGYSIQSPYLEDPSLAIGYVDSCADFWVGTWDENFGGFYTNIDKYGDVIYNSDKHMLTQTRNVYGLTRAFMLTGDIRFLDMAREGLDFMYEHSWDEAYGGWLNELDQLGNPIYPTSPKTAFYQHYAILGTTAYYEATRDTVDWNWLMTGYDHLDRVFWDTRPQYLGYFDESNANSSSAWDKSFNATVDAITTHLLYLYLMTEDQVYKDRLLELAEEMMDRLVGSMPQQAIGFVEMFDSDWNSNNNEPMTIMGHVLKTGWCLSRICQLEFDQEYIDASEALFQDVWDNGYDHDFGGPYKDYNRITGEMLMWGNPDTCKAWWQLEQAATHGLQMFSLTRDSLYLRMADESVDFYMHNFVDREYGEVYANRTRYGDFAWNENKGEGGKAGYHSIELGYYLYLYGNLFIKQKPVTIHYNFVESTSERRMVMTPIAVADSLLRIQNVLHEGQPYASFDPDQRILVLPPGVCGHFEVTFEPVEPVIVTENDTMPESLILNRNYPNPFNSSTTIEFNLMEIGNVQFEVFDIHGRLIHSCWYTGLHAGLNSIEWAAHETPNGVYHYRISNGTHAASGKAIVLR